MDELMAKLDEAQVYAKKIGCVAKVGGHLISMLTFMVTIPQPFGAAAAGIYLVYQIISGGLTWDDIVTACQTVWEILSEIASAAVDALLPAWLVNLWNKIKGKAMDELLGDLIDKMADWLGDLFPSAASIIDALAEMAKDVVSTVARVIRNIMRGGFSLDDFLDICEVLGGRIAILVAEMIADAAVEFAGDCVEAVGNFISDPPW